MSSKPTRARPTHVLSHDSLVTLQVIADLLDISLPSAMRWHYHGKIRAAGKTKRGAPLFRFSDLAVSLREIISFGVVPILCKRKKRGC